MLFRSVVAVAVCGMMMLVTVMGKKFVVVVAIEVLVWVLVEGVSSMAAVRC
mgnify:CR=1 FL=1